jgi:orotate phosphoribosyltransferase
MRIDDRLDALAARLREHSLQTGEFTLSSGRTSRYYIDARTTTMSAAGAALIGPLGLAAIREAGWAPQLVGGLTLGADPVAYAICAASMASPPIVDAFTVRKAAKAHGTGRRIEGCFAPGADVVVVEDVITSGGSALAAVEAIREAGSPVAGVLAVVDREEGGVDAIREAGLPVRVLLAMSDLAG